MPIDKVFDAPVHYARLKAAIQKVKDDYSKSDRSAASLIVNGNLVTDGISNQPMQLMLPTNSGVEADPVKIEIAQLLYETDIDVIAKRLVDEANKKIEIGVIPDWALPPKGEYSV